MPRRVNEAGLALIRTFEGLRLKSYRCPAGLWTIGYGHTSCVTPGIEIDEATAERYLREDAARAGAGIERLVTVPLTDNQFAALVSFVFNLGIGTLERSTLLKLLNRGQYESAQAQIGRFVFSWTGGKRVKLPGLIRRRLAETLLWGQKDA